MTKKQTKKTTKKTKKNWLTVLKAVALFRLNI